MQIITVVVHSLNPVQLCVAPHVAAHQASLSFTFSWSLLKRASVELMIPPNEILLHRPLSSCPQSFPASGSFPMSQLFRWPKYRSFSISPFNACAGFISSRIGWLDLLAVIMGQHLKCKVRGGGRHHENREQDHLL